MKEIAAALTDRIAHVRGVGRFLVPPARVRHALPVLAAGDADRPNGIEWEVVRSAAADWLPVSTFSTLFSTLFTKGRRIELLRSFLFIGLSDRLEKRLKEVQEKIEDGADEPEGPRDSWATHIASYRRAYRVSMEELLDEPWLLFLDQLNEIDRLRARDQLSFMNAYSGLRSEDGQRMIDAIRRRAGASADEAPDRVPARPDPMAGMTEEEKEQWRRKKEAEAFLVKRRLRRSNGAKG